MSNVNSVSGLARHEEEAHGVAPASSMSSRSVTYSPERLLILTSSPPRITRTILWIT
jgi:hypothetical protein